MISIKQWKESPYKFLPGTPLIKKQLIVEAIAQQVQQTNYSAQKKLQHTYGLVPIITGLDKFTNFLASWKDYPGVSFTNMLPFSAGTFMGIVMAWLVAIALILVPGGHFFDVAVRDLVMVAGAFVLAKLSVTEHTSLNKI